MTRIVGFYFQMIVPLNREMFCFKWILLFRTKDGSKKKNKKKKKNIKVLNFPRLTLKKYYGSKIEIELDNIEDT